MKDIKGFEGRYKIDKNGNVYSSISKKMIKPYKQKSGYLNIDLRKDGKRHKKLIHRLVAEAYLENENGLEQVDHIDNNIENNNLDNLQWISQRDNLLKSFKINSNVRNFRECELWNRDGFIKKFKSVSDCCRYCSNEIGLSYSSMMKYKKYRDYIIKV